MHEPLVAGQRVVLGHEQHRIQRVRIDAAEPVIGIDAVAKHGQVVIEVGVVVRPHVDAGRQLVIDHEAVRAELRIAVKVTVAIAVSLPVRIAPIRRVSTVSPEANAVERAVAEVAEYHIAPVSRITVHPGLWDIVTRHTVPRRGPHGDIRAIERVIICNSGEIFPDTIPSQHLELNPTDPAGIHEVFSGCHQYEDTIFTGCRGRIPRSTVNDPAIRNEWRRVVHKDTRPVRIRIGVPGAIPGSRIEPVVARQEMSRIPCINAEFGHPIRNNCIRLGIRTNEDVLTRPRYSQGVDIPEFDRVHIIVVRHVCQNRHKARGAVQVGHPHILIRPSDGRNRIDRVFLDPEGDNRCVDRIVVATDVKGPEAHIILVSQPSFNAQAHVEAVIRCPVGGCIPTQRIRHSGPDGHPAQSRVVIAGRVSAGRLVVLVLEHTVGQVKPPAQRVEGEGITGYRVIGAANGIVRGHNKAFRDLRVEHHPLLRINDVSQRRDIIDDIDRDIAFAHGAEAVPSLNSHEVPVDATSKRIDRRHAERVLGSPRQIHDRPVARPHIGRIRCRIRHTQNIRLNPERISIEHAITIGIPAIVEDDAVNSVKRVVDERLDFDIIPGSIEGVFVIGLARLSDIDRVNRRTGAVEDELIFELALIPHPVERMDHERVQAVWHGLHGRSRRVHQHRQRHVVKVGKVPHDEMRHGNTVRIEELDARCPAVIPVRAVWHGTRIGVHTGTRHRWQAVEDVPIRQHHEEGVEVPIDKETIDEVIVRHIHHAHLIDAIVANRHDDPVGIIQSQRLTHRAGFIFPEEQCKGIAMIRVRKSIPVPVDVADKELNLVLALTEVVLEPQVVNPHAA